MIWYIFPEEALGAFLLVNLGKVIEEHGFCRGFTVLLPVEYGVREAGRQEAVDATTATDQQAGLETVEGQGA